MSLPNLLVMALAVTTAVGPAWAHKVSVFAYVRGDSIHTESYFADGRKCQNATVSLLDAAAGTLATGTTDDQGMLTLPVPVVSMQDRGDLQVVLQASMGHRAEYTLPGEELWGGEAAAAERSAGTWGPAAGAAASEERTAAAQPGTGGAVARELASLTRAVRQLQRQQERASVRDIAGGIGYIVGLLGVYCYVRSRYR